MKRCILFAALALTAVLTGCDIVAEKTDKIFPTKPIALVIPPGYEIAVDGKAVKVFGQSECPMEDVSMDFLFGPSSLAGSSDCVVIRPTDKTVQARVVIEGKLSEEKWTIEREGKRVSLHRPGGQPVVPYDALRRAGAIAHSKPAN